MLPFFRKIRWRHARENNFFKYARYAVGEIVLVVIGILIALQINTWNENKKLNKLKDSYLIRLINDIEQDTANINHVRSQIDLNQAIIKKVITSLDPEIDSQVLDTSIRDYFSQGWLLSEFVPTVNAYTDLSQTGNMNILDNSDLVNEIIEYYGYLAQTENSYNVNKNWITPIDQELAQVTAAFEIDPTTSHLFSHKSRQDALTNLLEYSELLERNAAGHFWINQSLSNNLLAIKGISEDLLGSLHAERRKN